MKYFNRINSLSELKRQFRSLVIANHPDKGGDTSVMQEINAEFDALFSLWKDIPVDEAGQSENDKSETGREYRRNFYSANGWEGVRYDRNLSTKEIAARVRVYAKERWSDYKFSVRTEYYSGGSSIHLKLVSGPEIAFVPGSEEERRGYVSTCRNVTGFKGIAESVAMVVNDVCAYMNSYNYDDSDSMTDYFDVNFYTHINIGYYDQPYQVKAAKKARTTIANAEKEPVYVQSEAESDTANNVDFEIVEYSEKAIAIFGDTKQIKEQLHEIGGRFNKFLTYNGERRAGWIFSKAKRSEVEKLKPSNKVGAASSVLYGTSAKSQLSGIGEENTVRGVVVEQTASGQEQTVLYIDKSAPEQVFFGESMEERMRVCFQYMMDDVYAGKMCDKAEIRDGGYTYDGVAFTWYGHYCFAKGRISFDEMINGLRSQPKSA